MKRPEPERKLPDASDHTTDQRGYFRPNDGAPEKGPYHIGVFESSY